MLKIVNKTINNTKITEIVINNEVLFVLNHKLKIVQHPKLFNIYFDDVYVVSKENKDLYEMLVSKLYEIGSTLNNIRNYVNYTQFDNEFKRDEQKLFDDSLLKTQSFLASITPNTNNKNSVKNINNQTKNVKYVRKLSKISK